MGELFGIVPSVTQAFRRGVEKVDYDMWLAEEMLELLLVVFIAIVRPNQELRGM
jgi:hypothetical protein